MVSGSRYLPAVFMIALVVGFLGGVAHAWTVPFPGGEVRWGPGYGGVRFPYGDVRWGQRGGGVAFPGGGVTWGPPGGGKVRINVPGFSRDFGW